MAATNIGTLVVELLLKDKQFKSGLKGSTADMNLASSAITGGARKIASITSSAMKAAAASMVAFASASVVVGSNFEKQMAMVGALKGLDQTDQKFQQLEQHARHLGATTEFTATQAGEALESLARAGESVGDAIKMSSSALVLAGTSATTLDNATQLLVSTQRQFGLGAEDTERVTNVMSMAMRSSLLDFTSLREGMKYAGATGHGFKLSLEETTAAMAKFRDLGMEGSMAGTQFRSAMAFAGAETNKQTKVLKKYGLTVKDINPETHTFAQILMRVGKAGITTTDSMKVFGRIAGGSMAQLSRSAADGTLEMDKLVKKLEESSEAGNTAKDMYSAISNTVSFQAKIAVSALQELMITFFDLFKGPLQELVREIPKTLNTIAAAFKANSYELEKLFKQAFGSMTDFLSGSAEDWGTFLVNLTKTTLVLIAAMMPLVELLNVLAQNIEVIGGLMATAFGVKVLITFVAVVGKVTAALGFASAAVTVFGTTLTVTTGGLFAAVAAVGLLVTGVLKWVSVVRTARSETAALQKAEDRLNNQREKATAAEVVAMQVRLANVKHLARLQLETGTLTRAEQARYEATLKLTAADAAQKVKLGELIEVYSSFYTVSQLVNELGLSATATVEKRIKGFETEATGLRKKLAEYQYYHSEIEKLDGQTHKNQQAFFYAGKLGREGELKNEQDFVAEIASLKQQLGQVLIAQGNLQDNLASATADANRKAANSVEEGNDTIVTSTGQTTDKLIALQKRLADTVARLREKTHTDYMKASVDEQAFMKFQQQEQLNNITTAYAEYRAAHKGNAKKQRQIDIEEWEVKLEYNKTMGIKQSELQDDGAQDKIDTEKETAAAIQAINETAQERLQRLQNKGAKQSVKLKAEQAKAMIELAEADALIRLAIWEAYEEAIKDAQKSEFKDFGWDDVGEMLSEYATNLFPKLAKSIAIVGKVLQMGGEALAAGIGAVQGVFGAIGQFTGFSFDPMAMAQDLADAKAEAEAEGLNFNMEAEARKMVRGAVDSAITFIETLVEALPYFLDALINNLPRLFESIVAAIPKIIMALIDAIPKIVTLLIEHLPDIALALIRGIIKLLPVLIVQTIKLFFVLFFIEMPKLIYELLKGLLEGLVEFFKNLFKKDPDKKAARQEKRSDNKADRKSDKAAKQAAFSGMNYVPATMRMTVHKGEAIVPADRNAKTQKGSGPTTAGYGQAFGSQGSSGGPPIEISVIAEGRLLEAVQIKAEERGHATGMKKAIKRASGTRVGFQRGKYNAWS